MIIFPIFCRTNQSAHDFYFTSTPVDPHPNSNDKFVNLYPHSTDCWALLVPVIMKRLNFLNTFVHQPIFWLFTGTLLLLMMIRFLCYDDGIATAVLLTYGAFFTQLKVPHPQRSADYIWTICILMCAIFASIVLSGSIYGILVHIKYEPEIDTFQQLLATDLLIYTYAEGEDTFYVFEK